MKWYGKIMIGIASTVLIFCCGEVTSLLEVQTSALAQDSDSKGDPRREELRTRLSETKQGIKDIQRVMGDDRPTWNRENLSFIDAMLEQCRDRGYLREASYWDIRRKLSEEKLELLTLQEQVFTAELQGQEVPSETRSRLAGIEAKLAARALKDDERKLREAAWKRVDDALAGVNLAYSWHVVKVHLLRDLVNRCQRAEFYRNPNSKALPILKNMDQLVNRAREWRVEYGECFYGRREQEVLGVGVEASEKIAGRAEALALRLERMESERDALEKKVLKTLAVYGEVKDLGIPYRKPGVRIGADGKPTDLLFATLAFGADKDVASEEPLCFDVQDFSFWGLNMQSRGVVADPGSKRLADASRIAKEGNYYFKQAVIVDSWWRPCSYRDVSLLPENQRNDPELFLLDDKGKPTAGPNIWNPAIRSLLSDNLTAVSRYYSTAIPNLLMYEKLTWEDAALGAFRDVYGYNADAVTAFRTKLKDKFGSIDGLNQAWHTTYPSFESIDFPASPFSGGNFKPNALSYEFFRFRMESYMNYISECIRSLQKGDPGRPVGTQVHSMTGSFVNGTVPDYRLWKQLPATFLEDHHNNWAPSYAAMNMHYSLCLYAGKQPIETEFIWTYPRLIEPKSEQDYRVTAELGVWRRMVWGCKILQVYAPESGWTYNHGYFDEPVSCIHQPEKYFGTGPTGAFVREAATSLVVGKKRAREFWPILNSTEVVKPRIGLIVPTTSMINEYPFQVLYNEYPVYEKAFLRWERLLGTRDLDFRYVPEGAILDGDEKLNKFKVIILPYMTYFPDGLADILLEWTRAGGTLIAEGVPGVYNAYGFEKPALMKKLFGEDVKWKYAGTIGQGTDWRWDLTITPKPKIAMDKVLYKGKPIAIKASFGRGAVLVSGESFNNLVDSAKDKLAAGFAYAVSDKTSIVPLSKFKESMTRMLEDAISDAIVNPTVLSSRHKFEMVVREDGKGQRYLFVINPLLRETLTDEIFVDGKFRHVYDLGIGPRCMVPLKSGKKTGGVTSFMMRLAPGEGTCLKLLRN